MKDHKNVRLHIDFNMQMHSAPDENQPVHPHDTFIFYDRYDSEQKQSDPERLHTQD